MEAQEIYEAIQSNPKFQGLEILFRIQPNGVVNLRVAFGQAGTEQVQQVTEVLEPLGFRVSLFGAMIRFAPATPSLRERYEAMDEGQRAAADAMWEKMVRS